MYYKGLLLFFIEGNSKTWIWNRWNSPILAICWYTTFPCPFCTWYSHYTVILYIFTMAHPSSITSIASILQLILFFCFNEVYVHPSSSSSSAFQLCHLMENIPLPYCNFPSQHCQATQNCSCPLMPLFSKFSFSGFYDWVLKSPREVWTPLVHEI